METFLISRWRRFPSFATFATFATPEVVAEIVDTRTLDGCKDMIFEARAMFEVMRMLDATLEVHEQKLEVGPKGPGKDIRRKDNTVDGCNDIASRMRITVIDFNARSRLASRRTIVDNEV